MGAGNQSQSSKSNRCSLQRPPQSGQVSHAVSVPHWLLRSPLPEKRRCCAPVPSLPSGLLQHQHSFLEMAAGMMVSLPDLSCALRRWLLSCALICCGSIGIRHLHLFTAQTDCSGSLAVMTGDQAASREERQLLAARSQSLWL